MKTLVLGGIRSGKSQIAERLAITSALPVTTIVTAQIHDEEMRTRIDAHRSRRPQDWQIIEEPLDLAACIARYNSDQHCLLIDCLTLWISNLLCDDPLNDQSGNDQQITLACQILCDTVANSKARIILVANETGLGGIHNNYLARRFCDLSGSLNQALASQCEQVILSVAGLPHILKGEQLND